MHKRFGIGYHWMNINNPQTFSEKLQWLKKHGPTEIKAQLADKYSVREYVKEKLSDKYLVDLIPLNKNGDFVVKDVSLIDWDCLPKQFVLKLTKGSGFNIICTDKDRLSHKSTKENLSKWLKIDNYLLSREPQYKGKNGIICERLLTYNITDYKFFCFDGKPEFVELYFDRFTNHKKLFYNMDWEKAGFSTGGDETHGDVEPPELLKEMIDVAKVLSEGFPFVRVDLYEHNGRVYFGELTFHPAGGYTPITPRHMDYRLGEMIKI